MKTLFRAALAALLLAAPAGLPGATAEEVTAGDLTIAQPWSRPGLPNRPAAAYLTVSNTGGTGDRLVAARSPAFGTIELHTVERDGEVMKMMPVEAIPVPARGTATLAPGGYHLMLFDAERSFAEGESFPLTLVFEAAGEIEVEVSVARSAPEGGMDHSGMDHSGMDHSGHGME
jgi:hypothetical protein